jgi:hypothetical protein
MLIRALPNGRPIPPHSLVAIDRNRWSPSTGTGGRHRPEPVVVFNRNSWLPSAGVRNFRRRHRMKACTCASCGVSFPSPRRDTIYCSQVCTAPRSSPEARLAWPYSGRSLTITRRLLQPKVMQRTDCRLLRVLFCVLISGYLPHAPPVVTDHALALAHRLR